ncbi:unnamed protein product, partial [Sphacelaria rigidula]
SNHVAQINFKTVDRGAVFYLRLLLHHELARSFVGSRTVDGTVHENFEGAVRQQGMVTGNEECGFGLHESPGFREAKRLRALFIALVPNGGPASQLCTRRTAHELPENHLLLVY